MPAAGISLQGFAFGECVEGVPARSLGYRLLTPVQPASWSAEIERLARHLQAAPYADHWPATELFCSFLLADGRRVVALARYGFVDHTASKRRGGVEMVGVVGPADLSVADALAIYGWLRRRRISSDDLHTFGGLYSLAEVRGPAAIAPGAGAASPLLLVQLRQGNMVLFMARSPADPDQHLDLLEQVNATGWQWLPLIGAEFPLHLYAQRGPLVGWLPQVTGVAATVSQAIDPMQARQTRRRRVVGAVLGILLASLMAANLWTNQGRHNVVPAEKPGASVRDKPASARAQLPREDTGASRESILLALHGLLQDQGVLGERTTTQLLDHYQRLAETDERWRASSTEAKVAVGALVPLSHRSARQIEASVRAALGNKGYDPELVDLVCRRIQERLVAGNSGEK